MKYLFVCTVGLLISACSTNQTKFNETPECMNYRGMMTAPMDPRAMEDLKIKCYESRQK